jgi:hypothetical protein
MDINEASALAPRGLSNHCYSRYGAVTHCTFTWVRYTPKFNSKRGRGGVRKMSKKLCSIHYQLN